MQHKTGELVRFQCLINYRAHESREFISYFRVDFLFVAALPTDTYVERLIKN
jgi:hypothetical protein